VTTQPTDADRPDQNPTPAELDLDAARSLVARASGALDWLASPPDRDDEPWLEAPAYGVLGELVDTTGRLIDALAAPPAPVVTGRLVGTPVDQVAAILHEHEVVPWDVPELAARIVAALDVDRLTVERDHARRDLDHALASASKARQERTAALAATRKLDDLRMGEIGDLTRKLEAARIELSHFSATTAQQQLRAEVAERGRAACGREVVRLREGVKAIAAHWGRIIATFDGTAQWNGSGLFAAVRDGEGRLRALLAGADTPAPKVETEPAWMDELGRFGCAIGEPTHTKVTTTNADGTLTIQYVPASPQETAPDATLPAEPVDPGVQETSEAQRRVWALPEEPGPEVTAVRDTGDNTVLVRHDAPGEHWWYPEDGDPQEDGTDWNELVAAAWPDKLIDATPRRAQRPRHDPRHPRETRRTAVPLRSGMGPVECAGHNDRSQTNG